MTKKILIVLFALLILSVPYQQQYQQNVHAAIVSKVASAAAKKVAKVPIKELTKDIAFDLAAQAIGQQFNEKLTFKFEEGYEGYCMTEIKSDGSCGRVVQVKKDLTVEEINKIDSQVETEMDKAITGGKGFPKWQKFLDWFVPIWLISAGVTAITYAFDSDVRSLFNEIGYNTLVSLGLIKPVEPTGGAVVNPPVYIPDQEIETKPINDGEQLIVKDKLSPNESENWANTDSMTTEQVMNLVGYQTYQFREWEAVSIDTWSVRTPELYGFFIVRNAYIQMLTSLYGEVTQAVWEKDGVKVANSTPFVDGKYHSIMTPSGVNTLSNSMTWRMPYQKSDGMWVSDFYSSVGNERHHVQLTHTENNFNKQVLREIGVRTNYTGFHEWTPVRSIFRIDGNQPAKRPILAPYFEEVENVIPTPVTQYQKDDKIAFVPPAAVPIREVGTGETVTRTPAKTPDEEPIYQKPDGTIVPPDNIEVGDPVVTPSKPGQLDPGGKPIPEGTPVATPTPTPNNPTPAPVPLVPGEVPTNPTEPDAPTVPPGTEPPPTEQPFPEEPSCDAKLNFPRYIPFMNTLSNAFPFSIPWDIERALNAAFGEIGSERPGFDYTFDFMGSEKTWRVEVPKFFDSWKPFTDGLLLLIFDVGIMFGIYRFMKGGGS